MRRLVILALLASLGLMACERGVPVDQAVASITETDYLSKLGVIADDSMMGRADPSPGLDMTAQWVADQFRSYGLEPGGDDGTYIQHYTIREVKPDLEGSSAQVVGGPALAFGTDLAFRGGAADGESTAPVVLVVGNMTAAESFPVDQVRGKHIIVVPPATPPSAAGQGRRGGFMRLPAGMADAQPASVIFLDRSSDEDWTAQMERTMARAQNLTPWDSPPAYSTLTIR